MKDYEKMEKNCKANSQVINKVSLTLVKLRFNKNINPKEVHRGRLKKGSLSINSLFKVSIYLTESFYNKIKQCDLTSIVV